MGGNPETGAGHRRQLAREAWRNSEVVFNSLVFLVFFAVVYAAYRALPHRGQNRLLLVSSYVFYGWWDWRFAGMFIKYR